MKYTHNEYLFTRDHRTPEQARADKREAIFGWLILIAITVVVFAVAELLT